MISACKIHIEPHILNSVQNVLYSVQNVLYRVQNVLYRVHCDFTVIFSNGLCENTLPDIQKHRGFENRRYLCFVWGTTKDLSDSISSFLSTRNGSLVMVVPGEKRRCSFKVAVNSY